ncbi:MAG: cystathionine gamma-synthase [Pseudomonadota bacterium]|nr:MAG: cystathionine gamma-synthase [Pseudomonadota bacterium]
MNARYGPATTAARAGIESDTQFGAVVPPLHLSTTYSFAGFGRKRVHDYSRSGNPTRDLLAGALAELECGRSAVVTATGMAAITTVLQLLVPGDRLLAPHDCYGGTFRLLDACARRGAFVLEWLDFSDSRALAAALASRPRMVWLETPSNPLLRVTDIQAVAGQAHKRDALVVVDNTFLSPALQRPLTLGADIVVHSTTKYINGHSDVVGGAVIAVEQSVGEQLAWWANCIGVTASAFDSWLTLRGLRTLSARLAVHQHNAARLVALLQRHPAVERVHYPGLPGHPGHLLARRQQDGFGAMVSFELKGGEPAVRRLLEGLECFSLAESLGGVESLIAHPSTMTHAAMPAEDRARAGIGEDLLRLSVGLEAASDLVADLSAGLDRALALPGGRAPGVEKRHVRR